MEQQTKRQDDHVRLNRKADFEPPRLTVLGRVNDLTRDFVTPGTGDFTLTGFIS